MMRSKEKKEFNSVSLSLSLSSLFFYLWPPGEDRRDDPVLRELEPRGPADAGALLRGRLSREREKFNFQFFAEKNLFSFSHVLLSFGSASSQPQQKPKEDLSFGLRGGGGRGRGSGGFGAPPPPPPPPRSLLSFLPLSPSSLFTRPSPSPVSQPLLPWRASPPSSPSRAPLPPSLQRSPSTSPRRAARTRRRAA